MARSRTVPNQNRRRTSREQAKVPTRNPYLPNRQLLRARVGEETARQVLSLRGHQPPRLVKAQAPAASREIRGQTIYLTAHHTTSRPALMCLFPDTTPSDILTANHGLTIAGSQGSPETTEPSVATRAIPVRDVTQESIAILGRAGMETRSGMNEAVNMSSAERPIARAMRIVPSFCHVMAPTKGIGLIGTHVVVGLLSHPTTAPLPLRSNLLQLAKNQP